MGIKDKLKFRHWANRQRIREKYCRYRTCQRFLLLQQVTDGPFLKPPSPDCNSGTSRPVWSHAESWMKCRAAAKLCYGIKSCTYNFYSTLWSFLYASFLFWWFKPASSFAAFPSTQQEGKLDFKSNVVEACVTRFEQKRNSHMERLPRRIQHGVSKSPSHSLWEGFISHFSWRVIDLGWHLMVQTFRGCTKEAEVVRVRV